MTILVANLAVSFDEKEILSDISFEVPTGQIACLLGQSGCGKTTVLRSIMGFCEPKAGVIKLQETLFDKQSKVSVPAHLRRIGMVFQDYALFSHLTVADNILFGVRQLPKKERETILDELLTLTDMTTLAKRYPHELSGGQQQRVALARAFAMKPRLVLLDEPFSNLDVELRASLSAEVRALLKAQNMTAILVTHDQAEAFAMADVVGVMADGKLQQWADPMSLYQTPVNAWVAKFIGDGVLLTIEQTGSGQVTTALGVVPCVNGGEVKAGDGVLVRPEAVVLDDDGVPMTIMSRGFRGSHWRYELERGENRLLANVAMDCCHQVGDTVNVRVLSGWGVALAG